MWDRAVNFGFTGDYKDYHPGDDFLYLFDIASKFDPYKYDWRGKPVKERYMFAYEQQSYRGAIAGLQVLDCLMEKLGCEAPSI